MKTISEDDIIMFLAASIAHIKQLLKNPSWISIITIVLEAMSLCSHGIKCFKYIHAEVLWRKTVFVILRSPLLQGSQAKIS